MKKTYIIILSFVMALVAFSACQKEIAEQIDEAEDVTLSGPITINFSFDNETKALFGETGIKWAEGDVIRYTDQGLGNIKDITLNASDITNEGYTATVTTDGLYLGNKSVFRQNYSSRNVSEWDFGYYGGCPSESRAANVSFTEWNKLLVKQSEAGAINPYFIFLHSGLNAMDLTGQASVNVSMEIFGTIFRVLPYTTTHTGETIESVTLYSADRLGGCCTVNYSNGAYRDHKDVNWGPDSFKEYEVELTTGFALTSATTKANSKAIYFSLPALNPGHEIQGYAWAVKTDAAVYYFYATEHELAISQNKVRNVYLNLDNAKCVRLDVDSNKQLKYDGALSSSISLTSAAAVNQDLGWYAAYTSDNAGGSWTVQEANVPANAAYYSVETTITDPETGNPVSWLSCAYGTESTHILLNAEANTASSDRAAKVVISYPAQVSGYTIIPSLKTKTISVVQSGTAVITPVLSVAKNTADKAGEVISGTIDIKVDGVSATSEQFNYYVKDLTLTCLNGSVVRDGKTLTITVGANPNATTRDVVVSATIRGNNDSETIVQDAADAAKVYSFTYSMGDWSVSSCKPRALYYDNSAKSGLVGQWVILLTNLQESGVAYTAGAAFPSEDVEPLIKQVLGLSDDDYTAAASWLDLDIQVEGAQWIIVVKGMTANTTGVQRKITGSFKNDDDSDWDPAGTYTIGQNP